MEQSQLDEIRQLLQEVANPYEVKVQVNQAKDQLIIILNRQDNTQVDYSELAALIEEKLRLLIVERSLPSEIASFRLIGRVEGQSKPEWQTTFSKQTVNPTRSELGNFTKQLKFSSIEICGWILFSIGALMMLIGLGYDPTVESGDSGDRTYNIGAINIKSTYTNTGGFLAVCGAIFVTNPRKSNDKGATAEGSQNKDE